MGSNTSLLSTTEMSLFCAFHLSQALTRQVLGALGTQTGEEALGSQTVSNYWTSHGKPLNKIKQ